MPLVGAGALRQLRRRGGSRHLATWSLGHEVAGSAVLVVIPEQLTHAAGLADAFQRLLPQGGSRHLATGSWCQRWFRRLSGFCRRWISCVRPLTPAGTLQQLRRRSGCRHRAMGSLWQCRLRCRTACDRCSNSWLMCPALAGALQRLRRRNGMGILCRCWLRRRNPFCRCPSS